MQWRMLANVLDSTLFDMNHRFTSDLATYQEMIGKGWLGESWRSLGTMVIGARPPALATVKTSACVGRYFVPRTYAPIIAGKLSYGPSYE